MKSRILTAACVFAWAAASMYLVWYTEYALVGLIGFLILAVLNIYLKKQSTWSPV
jgi:hypothetical protein